jgi:hypothetical protein
MNGTALEYVFPNRLKPKIKVCAAYVLASFLPGPITPQAMELSQVIVDTTFDDSKIILPLLFSWTESVVMGYIAKVRGVAENIDEKCDHMFHAKEDSCF